LLIQRSTADDFCALPGGRVELGETGAETLQREMLEELGVAAEVGPLRILVENYFTYDGIRVHELGLYYDVILPESFPFWLDRPCHSVAEPEVTLEFLWAKSSSENLSGLPLYPELLRAQLDKLPPHPLHIVAREN
jgi:8-oxo-dGTP pyrophosphatase MutT (NUDIX family)